VKRDVVKTNNSVMKNLVGAQRKYLACAHDGRCPCRAIGTPGNDYDIAQVDRFDKPFGALWIPQNPTFPWLEA